MLITLTHSNLEQPLYLYTANLAGFHYSKKFDHTQIYTIGNVIFPVKESPEQIIKLLKKENNSHESK